VTAALVARTAKLLQFRSNEEGRALIPRTRYALLLALVAAAVADVGILFVLWPHGLTVDFSVFWQAARDLHPYAFSRSPFGNPPTALLFFKPLEFLPLWPAFALWDAAGLACFLWLGSRLYSIRAVILGVFSPAIIMALAAGQVSLIVGSLVFAAFLADPIVCGILLGIAVCLKPQMVFLAPLLFLFAREIRPLVAFCATGAGLSLLATVVFGPSIWTDWLRGMQNVLAVAEHRHALSLTISPITYGFPFGLLSAGLAVLGLYRCRNLPSGHRAAAVVAASLFAAPYALLYDLAPLAVFAALPIFRGSNWRSFGAALTYSAGLGPFSIPALWPSLREIGDDDGSGLPSLPGPKPGQSRRTWITPT
jgi:hypothetical protein